MARPACLDVLGEIEEDLHVHAGEDGGQVGEVQGEAVQQNEIFEIENILDLTQ